MRGVIGYEARVRLASLLVCLSFTAVAQTVPARSFFTLPSSNGHGAVIADTKTARVTHFREHLTATEEPLRDATGADVWVGNQPQIIASRGLLFDAYFGLRAGGQQRWLYELPTEAQAYDSVPPGPRGGSGIVRWTQHLGGLTLISYVFAPRGLPHASFVMVLEAKNETQSPIANVAAFSLHNFHLGFGRPGVMQPLQMNGETVVVQPNGDLEERAFAGVIRARPIGGIVHVAAWNAGSPATDNGFLIVRDTQGNLPTTTGAQPTADDWATAAQLDLGSIAPGTSSFAAVVVAHHGDPFAGATVGSWLDTYVGNRSAQQLLEAERAAWSIFQQSLTVPTGLSDDEQAVLRQSAVVLDMAQVRDSEAYLREFLTRDGEARFTRFDAGLPGQVAHRGHGAMLACLPPGEWTVAWPRDGSYAISALAALGQTASSRDALAFFLDAEGGRFDQWNELKPYAMPPYQVSLTRYSGFGVEETDFNDFGPNLEFDGFGLVLWALRQHELRTHDTSLVDARWQQIATRIGDPLVALIEPSSGLIRKDSSIWETHWNGRQRSWAYTSLTAARGLCDASALAQRVGDTARAATYRQAGLQLRAAIANLLVDQNGAIASNLEELRTGSGYTDAATLDAMAFGLFAPTGRISKATLAAADATLKAPGGAGWSRNDDAIDHPNAEDVSPWGSDYDRAEWAVTDLRGAIVTRAANDATRADALLSWVTRQAVANADLIPETFDQSTGVWKFNAPMVGFGAGAYVLALQQRADGAIDPACGELFSETSAADGGHEELIDAGQVSADAGVTPPANMKPCGCSESGGASLLFGLLTLIGRKRARS